MREPSSRLPSIRFLLVIAMSIVVVTVDQFTKRLVTDRLTTRGLQVIGDVVRLDSTRNTGAAFGVFPKGGATLAIVAFVVIAGILFSYRRVAGTHWVVRCGLGLIAGGACGNLIDRIRLGYVIDFIHLRWWPVFNLADSAITIGVILLALFAIREPNTGTRS